MRETAIFPLPIWGRFQLIFFTGKAKSPPYFYFRSIWPTDQKRATCWATHDDHFHQVWSWYDYPSPSYSVVGADTLRTLWLWPLTFWHWTVVKHGRSRGQSVNQVWRSYTYRSWLMNYDVRHRPPLTMRLEPMRMRRITWPVRRGQIVPKYLKSLMPVCVFTMQPPRLYDQGKLSYLPK